MEEKYHQKNWTNLDSVILFVQSTEAKTTNERLMKKKTKGIRCDAFKKFLGPKLDDAIMRDIKKTRRTKKK